ncbi:MULTISPECIES: DUF1656 domain-containing protein [Pandoraea]|jgi:hypothetical protein|uniref:Membrane protein n=1 Tax=Pandoraea pnomenusa TaxID=93220 RepID=A0A378YJ10_9BURK|nr:MULTISPECIES: DUF1656 domain-containing protein [Pandoraea]AHB04911.1 membrane protein [Pandoraea pnomenusa 3kgm]AHB74718.1 hypothetical protein X636_04125 [Pandoraea pnomenusa]AHN76938.1 hypothetical protein DA70_22545 [Pandoraea pnomenusa]AIU26517.1 hypothetical protein LV28_08175 [Pandoraea pnomenusa]ANC43744.1 hypothetical protein A6P55_05340 [Pandoraea pnomenusa]
MSGEIDIYGVFVPTLLALMVVAFVLTGALRFVLARIGFYKLVWHRSLFNLAVYIIALGGIVAIARAFHP